MKQIRVIKTFYIWRNNGFIDTKVEIHLINNEGRLHRKMGWIQTDEGWRKELEDLKSEFPEAKVRYFDLQKDGRIKHKYKVLSEDLKLKLGV